MTQERYQRVVEIFLEAADLAKDTRAAFLDEACEGDAELRRDVELLLAHDQVEDDLFHDERLKEGKELLVRAVETPAGESVIRDGSVPEKIGPFRILEKIGEGGMGTVYLAEQDHPRRRVALKMIRAGLVSQSLLKRFQFEAEVLGRLKHPGIAQIFEAGDAETPAGRLPYFAMEYIEGTELRRYAKEHGLGVRAALELAARIADAVHHAHLKGIVHRDLKPENVFVVREAGTPTGVGSAEFADLGQPKVLDFGVARATDADIQMTTMGTDTGQLVGTLTYMSPEQVAGDSRRLDVRSDIYALGAILYELLAGRPPFDLRHKPIPEAARIIREEEPTRLASIHTAFRGDIDTIVCKALEKDRDRRYASAAELAADLRRYQANEPIIAHPPSLLYQFRKFARRHKGLVAGLALSMLILVAGIVISLSFAVQAVKGEKLALHNEAEARRALRRLNISAADAVGETDPLRALTHLEAVPEHSRGWEWRHMHARIDSHIAEYTRRNTARTPWWYAPHSFTAFTASPSEGGPLAVFYCETGVELKDLASNEVLAVFPGVEEPAAPNLSLDGSRLVTLSNAEKKLIVWNVHTQDRLLEVPVVPAEIHEVCLNRDGSLLAYSSIREGAFVIETASGTTRFRTAPYPTTARMLAFSADESRLAVMGGNYGDHHVGGGFFYLYTYSSEGERLAHALIGHGGGALAFSPDGTRVAVGHHQRMISLFDAITLEKREILYGHTERVTALAFSPDGTSLASASKDRTTRIWDLDSGRTDRVLTCTLNRHPVTSIAFSQDGALLAAGNIDAVRLWAWRQDARLVLRGHKNYVYNVVFSPDGSLIASCDWDNKLHIWDPFSGEELAQFQAREARTTLCFSADGSRLIENGIRDPATFELLAAPRTARDEELLEVLTKPKPHIHFLEHAAPGGTRFSYMGQPAFAVSHDRSLVAVADGPGEIRIRGRATNEPARYLGKHGVQVYTVAFDPRDERLVSGDVKGIIKVWDLAGGKELGELKGHQADVFSVVYSPDGSRIASGSNDGTIILWDGSTFEQVAVLRGHDSYVHSVAFSPDGTMIASGSGDGTVRVWDTVLRAERFRQIRSARLLRSKAEPLVDRLLEELAHPLDAADSLRGDENLDEDLRREALRVLLIKSAAARGDRR